MKTLLDLLALGGGILGIITFFWRILDEFGSYLVLGLEVRTDVPGYAVAAVRIENPGRRSKSLDTAFLLIGPLDESPIDTYNKIADASGLMRASHTNDILRSDASGTLVIDEGARQLVPLGFFTSENVAVSDEKLACSVPIKLRPTHYKAPHSVRLLVGADGRLHRSVHDIILVDAASSPH